MQVDFTNESKHRKVSTETHDFLMTSSHIIFAENLHNCVLFTECTLASCPPNTLICVIRMNAKQASALNSLARKKIAELPIQSICARDHATNRLQSNDSCTARHIYRKHSANMVKETRKICQQTITLALVLRNQQNCSQAKAELTSREAPA